MRKINICKLCQVHVWSENSLRKYFSFPIVEDCVNILYKYRRNMPKYNFSFFPSRQRWIFLIFPGNSLISYQWNSLQSTCVCNFPIVRDISCMPQDSKLSWTESLLPRIACIFMKLWTWKEQANLNHTWLLRGVLAGFQT